MNYKNIIMMVILLAMSSLLINCSEESQMASQNISREAHQFRIFRRVVFYNGITDTYILQVEGYCSVVHDDMTGKLSVVIKLEDGTFLKHYLGLSDNVTYFAEQLRPAAVSDAHYKVIFKPSAIIPIVEVD